MALTVKNYASIKASSYANITPTSGGIYWLNASSSVMDNTTVRPTNRVMVNGKNYSGIVQLKPGDSASTAIYADTSGIATLGLPSWALPGKTAAQAKEALGMSSFAPKISPAFTGTPKAPTASAGTASSQIATTAFVSNAVTSAISGVSNAMTFKGTLGTGGTITSLPTAASGNTGYTYKVITASTYASTSAKVGDVFVSDGTKWVLIPSGDEPSGTVTNVAVSKGANDVSLVISGSPITSSGTITIGHDKTLASAENKAGESANKTLTSGGTFKVPYITADKNGHIYGLSDITLTMPTISDTNTANLKVNSIANKYIGTVEGSSRLQFVNGTDGFTIQNPGDLSQKFTVSVTHNDKVTSVAGSTGAVTAAQIATALTSAGYKLTDENTTYSVATTSAAGLMSAADKSKLDGLNATNIANAISAATWG